ncbi:recombinase family protein [Catenibacterium sp.]|uniref:recombinase family protein n=2 Tax=Catenibacterium sp. TaxID=2049022 RepID=UPI002E7891C9|nr:recombinase family protein [Catenibacterium sp.]MEE0821405.1 recombinase family protein [Catenibacterium sp.]
MPDNDVKKSAMFVFKDMEEFKTRGKDENGDLVINKEQAEVVKLIFDLYLGGKRILGIVKELKDRNIKSSTGKDNWPKRSVEKMLRVHYC